MKAVAKQIHMISRARVRYPRGSRARCDYWINPGTVFTVVRVEGDELVMQDARGFTYRAPTIFYDIVEEQ